MYIQINDAAGQERENKQTPTLWLVLASSVLCSVSALFPALFSAFLSETVLSTCGGERSSLRSAHPISPFKSPAVVISRLPWFSSSCSMPCLVCTSTPLVAGFWASCADAGAGENFSWILLASVLWWARGAGPTWAALPTGLTGEPSRLLSVCLEEERKSKGGSVSDRHRSKTFPYRRLHSICSRQRSAGVTEYFSARVWELKIKSGRCTNISMTCCLTPVTNRIRWSPRERYTALLSTTEVLLSY